MVSSFHVLLVALTAVGPLGLLSLSSPHAAVPSVSNKSSRGSAFIRTSSEKDPAHDVKQAARQPRLT
jgi:hypothetical protein